MDDLIIENANTAVQETFAYLGSDFNIEVYKSWGDYCVEIEAKGYCSFDYRLPKLFFKDLSDLDEKLPEYKTKTNVFLPVYKKIIRSNRLKERVYNRVISSPKVSITACVGDYFVSDHGSVYVVSKVSSTGKTIYYKRVDGKTLEIGLEELKLNKEQKNQLWYVFSREVLSRYITQQARIGKLLDCYCKEFKALRSFING